MNNCKCPKCSNCVKNKTTDYFKQEIFELVNNEYTVLGEYTGARKKLLIKHNICENVWDTTPDSFLRGKRCPICQCSKGERQIEKCLTKNKINYIPQKQFDGLLGVGRKNLSYDFYLPDYNLLIEYQGEFHDGNTRKQTKNDIERQQEHDKRKRDHAQNNNIKLLEIWYYDFDNIEEILNKELLNK
jgi:hypothetical protein